MTSGQTQTSATEALSTYISNLDYFVFRADKSLALSGSQTLLSTNTFGSINMKLAAGTYTIVVFGYYYINDTKIGLSYVNQSTLDQFAIRPFGNTFPDTFIKKLEFTVGSGNSIPSTLTLNRYTAKIEIVSADLIPATVSYISASMRAPGSFNVNSEVADMADYKTTVYVGSDAGKNMVLNIYNIVSRATNGQETGLISLDIYGSNNTLLGTKLIESRTIYRNQKVTLTGNLFDNLGTTSTQVGVNGEWSSTVTDAF